MKKPGIFGFAKECALSSWKERFGCDPTWSAKHYVNLARILRAHPELSEGDFKARWTAYLDDRDPFLSKLGYSLAFFCSRFDAYMVQATKPKPRISPFDSEAIKKEYAKYSGSWQVEELDRNSEDKPGADPTESLGAKGSVQ